MASPYSDLNAANQGATDDLPWYELAFAIRNLDYYHLELSDLAKPMLSRRYEMFDTAASVGAGQTGEFFEQLEANMRLLRDICVIEGIRRGLILANSADPREVIQ